VSDAVRRSGTIKEQANGRDDLANLDDLGDQHARADRGPDQAPRKDHQGQDRQNHRVANYSVKAIGTATRFQCALVKKPHKGRKQPRTLFGPATRPRSTSTGPGL
jgi:hypothetical protein